MNILIATDTYYPHINGCSYFTQRLAHNLEKRGHSILVIAPSKNTQESLYIKDGVHIFALRSIPLYYNNFSICLPVLIEQTIEKAVLDFKPDIIHIQGHFTISKTILKIAKRHCIPIVGTNHFMPENLLYFSYLPDTLETKLQGRAWKEIQKVFGQLNAVSTPTQTAASLLERFHFPQSVTPISNGVDRKRFRPDLNGQYLRKRYSIPEKPTLLYVGRLDKEKNIDLVINAFSLASQKVDAHLIIAGSGTLLGALKILSKERGIQEKITFTGFIPDEDLPHLYCLADVFIVSGTAELQSIVTMEAMASGLPIIAANAVALPELVHDKKNGFLFKPGNTKEVAENMYALLANPKLRKNMSQESLKIIEKHDIQNTIHQFELFYQDAIQKKGSSAT